MSFTFPQIPGLPISWQWPSFENFSAWDTITLIVKATLIFLGANYFARRHPLFFVSGLVTGVVFDQKVAETSDKIKDIFQKNIINGLAMGWFTLITLPITLDFLTFGFAAKLSSMASLHARHE